jgi:outer membrane protein assembly factor BamB
MWRCDASRSAESPTELPDELHPLWERKYDQRIPVWDDPLNQDLMPYDRIFEPIVYGKTLFLGFNDQDKVVAIDTETGREKWTHFVDGPVRLPLAAWNNRLFFTSDDGFLYCLAVSDGSLLWKKRGGPSNRKILGNNRLISTWPARGGAVVSDGKVYFAASIWPFMGTFIYALDAETGKTIWQNNDTGAQYIKQPHNSPSFAGVGPQGALVVSGDKLLVPGGRSIPAVFNRNTGEFLHYRFSEFNKTGGAFVCANDSIYINHQRDRNTSFYQIADGKRLEYRLEKYPVITNDEFIMSGDSIVVRSSKNLKDKLSVIKVDASKDLIKAGSHLYAAGNNQITCVEYHREGENRIIWKKECRNIERLVAADKKLFAVTLDGRLIAFGETENIEKIYSEKPEILCAQNIKEKAALILHETGITEGYAIVFHPDDGEIVASLAEQSDLHIISVAENAEQLLSLRNKFDNSGLLGRRLTFLQGNPNSFQSPPYMASLILINDAQKEDYSAVENLYNGLRPFGGTIWFDLAKRRHKKVLRTLSDVQRQNIIFSKIGLGICRSGPLKGASNWTHQYGGISNTVKSDDQLVKLPLGLLWFGGSSNMDVLPRHGHGPPEQIVDGRLIIEGMYGLSARDVYTGRVLWTTLLDSLNNFGQYFNESYKDTPLVPTYNQEHMPGANSRGTNYVATHEGIYIIDDNKCKVLNSLTGETLNTIVLPKSTSQNNPEWGYIGVYDQLLIAGSGFVRFSKQTPLYMAEDMEKLSAGKKRRLRDYNNFDNTASQKLVVMDRISGKVKWHYKSRYGFIHNGIAAGNGAIYCLDKYPPAVENKRQRRGEELPRDYRIVALDSETGALLWERNSDIFGSWLSISEQHNYLIQATRPSRDMVVDEVGKRMIILNSITGEIVWDKAIKYNNPPIIHGAQIITDRAAYDIHNGSVINRIDPLTGEEIPWTYSRKHGCNYSVASEHLLSFRSAAAGFYDLSSNGGTGNLGGFKSGCTSNLIAANGVLNAPDYTRTCQCSYQNQTSLAFVHMPELEYWTTNNWEWSGKPISKIGINLNAPGDRMADDDVIWLDFPSVGGESPDIPITLDSTNISSIRRHSSLLQQNGLEWIGASALEGDIDLTVTLSDTIMNNARYTVTLLFAEMEDVLIGERVFDVYINGEKAAEQVDIINSAGEKYKTIDIAFPAIAINKTLRINCKPTDSMSEFSPILSGIKIVRE